MVLALGTIESTRLALLSFPNKNGLIGKNLMAHLRSNTTIRIPRSSFAGLPDELEASALFVKGRKGKGHFHLQITACGVRGDLRDSESEGQDDGHDGHPCTLAQSDPSLREPIPYLSGCTPARTRPRLDSSPDKATL